MVDTESARQISLTATERQYLIATLELALVQIFRFAGHEVPTGDQADDRGDQRRLVTKRADLVARIDDLLSSPVAASWSGMEWTPSDEGGVFSWEPTVAAGLKAVMETALASVDLSDADALDRAEMTSVLGRVIEAM